MRRGYGNFPIFYPENCRTFWRTARRTVREQFAEMFAKWPFLQFRRTLFMNISTSSPNCSPNDLVCLPDENCSWKLREEFAELFAQWPFLPPRRTLSMNSSRTVRRTVRQNPFSSNLANSVHEQFANNSPNCWPNDLFRNLGEHCSWTPII